MPVFSESGPEKNYFLVVCEIEIFTFKHKTYFKIWKKYTATNYEFTATLVEKCFSERRSNGQEGEKRKDFYF